MIWLERCLERWFPTSDIVKALTRILQESPEVISSTQRSSIDFKLRTEKFPDVLFSCNMIRKEFSYWIDIGDTYVCEWDRDYSRCTKLILMYCPKVMEVVDRDSQKWREGVDREEKRGHNQLREIINERT